MSNYANTKATIAANVYENHLNQVTANMAKAAINAVVDTLIAGGFLYKGVATTSTNPGSPDANVFYIASTPGTYTNFGSLVVNDGEVAILKYNGSWSKEVTGAATSAEVSALGHKVDENYTHITGEIVTGPWEMGSMAPGTPHIPDYAANNRIRMPELVCQADGNYTISCESGYEFLIYVVGKITTATWSANRVVSLVAGDVFRLALRQDPAVDYSSYTQAQIDAVAEAAGLKMVGPGYIPELDGRVDVLEDVADEVIESIPSVNLFDKTKTGLGYINSNGGISADSSGNYIYSLPIPCEGNKYYLLVGRTLSSSYNIRCLDASNTPMKVLAASTGQAYASSWGLPNEAGDGAVANGQFKTPAGAVSVQFNIKFSSGSADNIMLLEIGDTYNPDIIPPDYVPYGDTFMVKDTALPALVSRDDVYYKDGKEVIWMNDLLAEGGDFRTRQGKRCTLPILLKKGETARIKTAGDTGYTMTPIVKVSGPFARVQNGYYNTILVTRTTNSVAYYKYTATEDIYISLCGTSDCAIEFDVNEESRIARLESITSAKLRDKHIYVFGASNTSNSTAGVVGFMRLIAAAAGLQYRPLLYDSADGNTNDVVIDYPALTNYAKDGTCLRDVTGRTDGVIDRIKRHIQAATEVDYVVLGFPANDAADQYRNIGEISASYTAAFDTETQIGALEEVCRYVTELGKPLHFGCIIPWKIIWVADDFYDNYIPVLKKWCIPYLDLRECAGFDLKDCAVHRNLYSLTSDNYNAWDASTTYNLDDKVKYGGSLYKCNANGVVGIPPTDSTYWMLVSSESADGTHLNTIGNAIVAGKILSFIESL